MKFIVNEPSPSQNVTDNMFWKKKAELKEQWYWLAEEAIRIFYGSGWRKTTSQRYNHVKITRYCTKKRLDVGNMIGGLKMMVDNLIDLGLIEDDSPDKCTLEYHQETGKPYRTEFELSIR